ncbi:MAG: hypothetical protein JSW59_04380 [Phycisphaerales bacterium]|nr:MAG: hypothetical protein JSW59_04380 [Phycisphaerales bacterium]
MKKTAVFLGVLFVIVLGPVLFVNFLGDDEKISNPVSIHFESGPAPMKAEAVDSSIDEASEFTRYEFDQLPQDKQDQMMEDYVLDFWAKELGLTEPDNEEKNLSLEIFNRPYMQTLTERELFQLLPEDREKAMAEVMENCAQIRSYVHKVIAEAESFMAEKDYANAEAYFVYCLETGRELSVNKEGLIITRLVGIACEKLALNGLVKLYTEAGDSSKAQMARDELAEIEEETLEIKRTAKENEASR